MTTIFRAARFGVAALASVLLVACGKGVSIPPAPAPTGLQFQTLNAPTSVFPTGTNTLPTGIRGSFVTAIVDLSNGASVGALYSTTLHTWSALAVPNASSTQTYGPDVTSTGYRIVGTYTPTGQQFGSGFVYDSSSGAFTTLTPPTSYCSPNPCNETIAHSAYGDATYQVVGNTDAVTSPTPVGVYSLLGHAWLYDSSTGSYSDIDYPNSISSTAYGIWNDSGTVAVAGGFTDARGIHAYVRALSGSNAVVYDYPGAAITHFEGITGAGGPGNYNVAGDYSSAVTGQIEYGFFLPIRNWQAGTPVILGAVSANSVYQQTVVGITTGVPENGYIVTVPGTF